MRSSLSSCFRRVCTSVCYFRLGLRPSSIYQVTHRNGPSERNLHLNLGSGRGQCLFALSAVCPLPACLACGGQDWKSVPPPWLRRLGCVVDPTVAAAFASDSITLVPTSLITSPRLTNSSTTLTFLHKSRSYHRLSLSRHHHIRSINMSEQEKSSSSGEGGQAKKITMEQLQEHDKTGDLWLLMDGKGGYLLQGMKT